MKRSNSSEKTVTIGKVVDASAAVALLFDETTAGSIAATLQDERLHAPKLLFFEFANECLKKIKAYADKREIFLAAIDALQRMNIEVADVDFRGVLQLAEKYGLTAYDASYLWLARELGAELVTLDAKLERAYSAMARQSGGRAP
jgi:predicted nucleic acid-binding protein